MAIIIIIINIIINQYHFYYYYYYYYFTVNEVQTLKNKTNLNIFHSNINGLDSKFDNLYEFISGTSSEFDIIAITETSQINDFFTSNVSLEGYHKGI